MHPISIVLWLCLKINARACLFNVSFTYRSLLLMIQIFCDAQIMRYTVKLRQAQGRTPPDRRMTPGKPSNQTSAARKSLTYESPDEKKESKSTKKGKGPGKTTTKSSGYLASPTPSMESPPLHTQKTTPKGSFSQRHKNIMSTEYCGQGVTLKTFTGHFARSIELQEADLAERRAERQERQEERRLQHMMLMSQLSGGNDAGPSQASQALPALPGPSQPNITQVLIANFLKGMDPATKAACLAAMQGDDAVPAPGKKASAAKARADTDDESDDDN